MAKLYIVATPIGNLGDITYRAVEILKEVDFILAEDTRVTKKLLSHYGIETPTISYPADDRKDKIAKFIAMLREGKDLALVTDAGTPGISDPGSQLVAAIREIQNLEAKPPKKAQHPKDKKNEDTVTFLEAQPPKNGIDLNLGPSSRTDLGEGEVIEIVPIPGPSAVIAALSASGLNTSDFLYLGFLPHKKGRETLFKEIAAADRLVVFYESPHRILKTLESLHKFAPEKKVMIARELTKMFEEFVTGSPAELLEFFTKHEEKVRGEFVVVVS